VSLNDFKGRAAVLLWDAETGKAVGALKYPTGSVGPLAWSRDGSRLAVATTDDVVTIWDPKTQRKLGTAKRLSYMSQKTRSLDFSPDGSHLVGSTDFGTAPLWRIDANAAN
jgi:WD40 repeat protein